jgi:hypothetical protein
VKWDHAKLEVDLFSEGGNQKGIFLPSTATSGNTKKLHLHDVLFYTADVISIVSVVLAASVYLTKSSSSQANNKPIDNLSNWSFLRYALLCFVFWSIYLATFWPGVLSNDSIDQWRQMLSGCFFYWHPVFHTLTNWLITRIWLSPATIVKAQIVALSAIAG